MFPGIKRKERKTEMTCKTYFLSYNLKQKSSTLPVSAMTNTHESNHRITCSEGHRVQQKPHLFQSGVLKQENI